MPDVTDPVTAGGIGAGAAAIGGFLLKFLFERGTKQSDEERHQLRQHASSTDRAIAAIDVSIAEIKQRLTALEDDRAAASAERQALVKVATDVARVLEAVGHLSSRIDDLWDSVASNRPAPPRRRNTSPE